MPKNNRKIDLEPYSGKWVAFIDERLIDSSQNLSLLMGKLKKHKHLPKEPSVMLVPHKDEGPYLLMIL